MIIDNDYGWITQKRKGDSTDPFISVSEQITVIKGKAVLREIPDEYSGITISDGTKSFFIKNYKKSPIPDTNNVVVDFNSNWVYFDTQYNNKQYTATYKGTGKVFIHDKMIATTVDENGNVTETLDSLSKKMNETMDSKIASVDGKIAAINTATSAAQTATGSANTAASAANTAATTANNTVNDINNDMKILHKGTVATYASLPTTGLQVGDTYVVTSDSDTARNGVWRRQSNNTWLKINALNLSGAETVANVTVVDQARADIVRETIHSGVTSISALTTNSTSTLNGFTVKAFTAYVNGYKVSYPDTVITLPAAPTYGVRDDLVFLEAWFTQGGNGYQLNSRIRTVAGVQFNSSIPEGFLTNPNDYEKIQVYPLAQGGGTTPVAASSTNGYYLSFMRYIDVAAGTSRKNLFPFEAQNDNGLYMAGRGTQADRDVLKSIDGYVYAIPLFRVKRRNSGGYRADNVNGALDFTTATFNATGSNINPGATKNVTLSAADYDKIIVGTEYYHSSYTPTAYRYKIISKNGANQVTVMSTGTSPVDSIGAGFLVSDRPDGLYSNVTDAADIIDLRHKVTPSGVNYASVVEEGFDKLIRGELSTNVGKAPQKETFGLTRAPLGLKQELQPVTVKRADGTNMVLTNLLGTAGGCESVSGWFLQGATPAASNLQKRSGASSFRMAAAATNGSYGMYTVGATLDKAKQYILGCWMYIESRTSPAAPDLVLYDATTSRYSAGGLLNYSLTGAWQYIYVKIPQNNTLVGDNVRVLLGYGSAGASTVYYDEVRLYEVSAADYTAIGTTITGADVDALLPYVDSLPNYVENLFTGELEVGAIKWLDGTDEVSTSTVRSKNYISALSSNTYSVSTGNLVTSEFNIHFYDKNKAWLGAPIAISSKTGVFTTPLNCAYVRFLYKNNDITTSYQLEKGSIINPLVPQGRWFIPADYQGYNTGLGNTDVSHYGGKGRGEFTGQRSVFGDALTTETRSDVIDALRTPQAHITVSQATEGTWAVGNVITINTVEGTVYQANADVGQVSGLYNNLASPGTVSFDKIPSGIAVGNTVKFAHLTLGIVSSGNYTVSAIDTANKTITFTWTGSTIGLDQQYILTSNALTPTVIAPGIAGTWTGLGTRSAAYTITTAPTATAGAIKIDYSVTTSAGRGIGNVPVNIDSAEVNGERLLQNLNPAANANFAGKSVENNTDLIPHKAFGPTNTGNATSLQIPSNSNWYEFRDSHFVYKYSNIATIDGVYTQVAIASNTAVAQQLFSFDLIRAIEDKFGEIPGCLTTADKITWIRANLSLITTRWYGYGVGPSGNKASFASFNVNSGTWYTPNVHTANTPTLITDTITAPASTSIDANGFVHYIAYADASDGAVASTLNTDYIELQINLSTIETGYTILKPENPFPVLSNNLLYANQALPIDPSGFAPSWLHYLGTTWSIEEPGTIKIQPHATTTLQGVSSLEVPTTPGYHSASFMFRGDAGREYFAVLGERHQADPTAGTVNKSISFIATGDWQTVKVEGMYNAGRYVTLGFSTGTSLVSTPYYVKKMIINKGASAFLWTPGRNVKRTINLLGKYVGSLSENPSRGLYATSNSFSAPISITNEFDQTTYDAIGKQDGVLTQISTSTTGQYAQRLFEFDLSQLGLSLKELKAVLRTLSVTWIGYGVGTNAGAVTYGATVKMWKDGTQSWAGGTGGWQSTSSTVSAITNGDASTTNNPYPTKDQKVYVLVHTTYAAGTQSPSNLYTDYVRLDVTLADYVDYKKSNIVKVRPETKEIKLMFPASTYRYLGGGAQTNDVVSLNYRYLPYQGCGDTSALKILTDAGKAFMTTFGTGKSKLTTISNVTYSNPITVNLPIGSIAQDSAFVLEGLFNPTAQQVYDLFNGLNTQELNHGSSAGYRKLRIGETFSLQNLPVTRGFSSATIRNFLKSVPPSDSRFNAVGGILWGVYFLVANASGELLLVVCTTTSRSQMGIDGTSNVAVDYFKLPGRPLLKGV